jgi:hypothetical protein
MAPTVSVGVRRERLAWRDALWIAACLLLITHFLPLGVVGALIALPIVTLVPGWPLLVAIFGNDEHFDTLSTIVLAIALGICADIACGLLIGSVGVGFGSLWWLTAIAIVTWLATVVAQCRRADLSFRVPFVRSLHFPVAVTIGVFIAAISVAITVAALARPTGTPYTEFSFAEATAVRADPLEVARGSSVTLPVEVRRVGNQPTTFQLLTSVDGSQVANELVSVPGPTWSGAVRVPVGSGGCLHRIVLQLRTPSSGDGAHELVTYVRGIGAPCHS